MPPHPSLIALTQPQAPATEAFRQLRTSLQFGATGQPVQTVLVTSTTQDEGKSTVAANLAITLAQAGRSVVLVDCDLRRPSLHLLFDVPGTPGLSEALAGGALALQACGVDRLQLLTCGQTPPNPAELLASARMRELIAELRGGADCVLFDAPPVVAVTDAVVVASQVDGVLLVLKAAVSKRDAAQRAKQQLEQVHAQVLGVVLTGLPGGRVGGVYGAEPVA